MRRERLAQTTGYYGAFGGLGLAMAVLGPTLPALAEATQAELSEISLLFSAASLGYLLGSLQGGRLYDRVPGHPVMVACLGVMAAMLAVVPTIPWLWLLALVELVLGLTAATVDVGGNTLMVWVHGHEVGPYMNALHFFFGLGAFLSPIIVAQAMLWSDSLTWAYWPLALLILPAAIWLLRLPSPSSPTGFPDGPADAAVTVASRRPAQSRRLAALMVVLFFLYVGAEVGFGGWIYTYAVTMGLATEGTGAYLASAFWGALTVGRLLSVPISTRVRPRWVLTADLAGCLASTGILLMWPESLAATWLGTLGLGASMASLFPTLISLAGRRMTLTGQITGWFLAGSSAGGMFLPWLIGQLFEAAGPRSTMTVLAIDLLAALGIFAALMIESTHQQHER